MNNQDDLSDVDPDIVPCASQELVPIQRLAQRARGDGIDRGPEAIGDPTEPTDRIEFVEPMLRMEPLER